MEAALIEPRPVRTAFGDLIATLRALDLLATGALSVVPVAGPVASAGVHTLVVNDPWSGRDFGAFAVELQPGWALGDRWVALARCVGDARDDARRMAAELRLEAGADAAGRLSAA